MNTNTTFSQPEILCIAAFLIIGIFVVLAIRHPKQAITGLIALPIAGLCGGSSYLVARLLYYPHVGTLYGLAAFALAGLIVISVLRWIASVDTN